jgi:two-component system cell cycle sensor histidine kinase/response regulator CckA
MLLSFGYAVAVVHTGGEALREVDRFAAEVVVLDVNLPDIGGEVVFRLLRQRWPSIPVVFSSGHVRNLREVGAEGRSRVALLQKPYEGEQLIEAIERVFAE